MDEYAVLMQKLIEIQSGGRPRETLMAEDERVAPAGALAGIAPKYTDSEETELIPAQEVDIGGIFS